MSDMTNLQQQLDAELTGALNRAQQKREELERTNREREERLKQFDALVDRLRPVWAPRLELLRDRFAKLVKGQPEVTPHTRSITFKCTSKYRLELKLSAYPDQNVKNLVLEYDLVIVPLLGKYDRQARLEMPLDRIDEDAIGRWLDERIVSFVKTYVALEGDSFFVEHLTPE
jgi:hypothetical protein